ncbi:MG2 domain-containing protein [Pedobacter sp.]|uniref:MG2 domain-containing protein n=1 Tax=Pedobacter sp. TaxID=1411316 RepID=UPI003BA90D07
MNEKKTFLLFVLSCCFIYSFAQQANIPSTDPKTVKLFFEKVYLQTDRTYYGTGEDIWFSAYLVNGKSTSLTATSNNLYVELISPKSVVLDRKVTRLENGLGKGDFKLNDAMPSGWYNIRAYTNWMRNFNNDFVFQKRIYLGGNAGSEKVDEPKGIKKLIAFYPEGGALVEGVNSIVAFKANDEQGNGLKTKASIISSGGDTVTTFQSTDLGLGIFAFAPKANEQYRIEGFYANEKFSTQLPSILKKGLVLHLSTDSATIKATISANEEMFKALNNKSMSIVIKHAGDNIYTGSLKMTKSSVSVSIPTQDFPRGIAVVTLVDEQGKPHCERLVFISGNNAIRLMVSQSKSVYQPREKVTLNIRAVDILGRPVKASVSLAAVDGLIPQEGSNLVSYLLLQSEIKGEIKNADQYFDVKNPSAAKQLDLLLLTQGWRDYLWRRLADSAIKVSYMPEPGFTIKGFVREKLANKPLPNMNITLFGSGFVGNKIYTTKTDENGHYFLDGLNWTGNQAVKISSQNSEGKKGGWLQIDSAFTSIPINLKRGLYSFSPDLNAEMAKRMEYRRTYKFGDSITLNDVEINANKNKEVRLFNQVLTSFGYPDQVFNITAADYDYKGLEHFLLTKAKGAQSADDLDSVGNEGVLFISNGKKIRPRILINNREDLFGRLDYYSLTMDQINQVVIRHLVDNEAKDVYVISLNLKDSALRGPNLNLLNINLNGYYNARTFYAPNYNISNSQAKDLRTTLYWNPSIKTSDKGAVSISFFNSDNKGNVVVKTDGITENGHAVSDQFNYKVQ